VYYTDGDYSDAKEEFEASKSLYDQIGDANSQEAQSMIDICNKYIDAQERYEEGMEYSNDKKFEEALVKFRDAQTLYQELEDTERTEELQTKIDETQTAREKQISKNKMIILFGILIVVAVVFLVVIVFLRKPPVSEPSVPLPGKTVYCPSCGKENPISASNCERCGTPLKSIDELEKEKAMKKLRKKLEEKEISEEEYHKAVRELKKEF